MFNTDLDVRRGYCTEHSENDHWLDENFVCHGRTLQEIESHGYSYARHIGGGWFRLKEKYSKYRADQLDLEAALIALHDDQFLDTNEPDF
jgi:hypothetical protein